MNYKIVTDKNYRKFKQKIVESLKNNWKLHGHTQYPLEVVPRGDQYYIEENGEQKLKCSAVAVKGQYSQAMIKYDN